MAKMIGRFHRESPEDYGLLRPEEPFSPKVDFSKVAWREDNDKLVWAEDGKPIDVAPEYLDPEKPRDPRKKSSERSARPSRSRSPSRRRRN